MDQNSEKTLNDSLQRCLQDEDFIAKFYQSFVASDQEISDLFAKTDMQHQQAMMGKSLMSMISASEENWSNDQHLAELAKHHRSLNIQAKHFDLWEQSLLKTIKECDPEFDENVANAWRKIIARGKTFMSMR